MFIRRLRLLLPILLLSPLLMSNSPAPRIYPIHYSPKFYKAELNGITISSQNDNGATDLTFHISLENTGEGYIDLYESNLIYFYSENSFIVAQQSIYFTTYNTFSQLLLPGEKIDFSLSTETAYNIPESATADAFKLELDLYAYDTDNLVKTTVNRLNYEVIVNQADNFNVRATFELTAEQKIGLIIGRLKYDGKWYSSRLNTIIGDDVTKELSMLFELNSENVEVDKLTDFEVYSIEAPTYNDGPGIFLALLLTFLILPGSVFVVAFIILILVLIRQKKKTSGSKNS